MELGRNSGSKIFTTDFEQYMLRTKDAICPWPPENFEGQACQDLASEAEVEPPSQWEPGLGSKRLGQNGPECTMCYGTGRYGVSRCVWCQICDKALYSCNLDTSVCGVPSGSDTETATLNGTLERISGMEKGGTVEAPCIEKDLVLAHESCVSGLGAPHVEKVLNPVDLPSGAVTSPCPTIEREIDSIGPYSRAVQNDLGGIGAEPSPAKNAAMRTVTSHGSVLQDPMNRWSVGSISKSRIFQKAENSVDDQDRRDQKNNVHDNAQSFLARTLVFEPYPSTQASHDGVPELRRKRPAALAARQAIKALVFVEAAEPMQKKPRTSYDLAGEKLPPASVPESANLSVAPDRTLADSANQSQPSQSSKDNPRCCGMKVGDIVHVHNPNTKSTMRQEEAIIVKVPRHRSDLWFRVRLGNGIEHSFRKDSLSLMSGGKSPCPERTKTSCSGRLVDGTHPETLEATMMQIKSFELQLQKLRDRVSAIPLEPKKPY